MSNYQIIRDVIIGLTLWKLGEFIAGFILGMVWSFFKEAVRRRLL